MCRSPHAVFGQATMLLSVPCSNSVTIFNRVPHSQTKVATVGIPFVLKQ
jgi:hypothetical protein